MKNRFRKIMCALLVFCLLLSLTACGDKQSGSDGTSGSGNVQAGDETSGRAGETTKTTSSGSGQASGSGSQQTSDNDTGETSGSGSQQTSGDGAGETSGSGSQQTSGDGAGQASDNSSKQASDDGSSQTSGSDPGSTSRPSEPIQRVKDAREAASALTTGTLFLLKDGSVLTTDHHQLDFAKEYAALPGLKKIIDSCSEMEMFALTENGEVYYHGAKIMDGVLDGAYSTTNVNQAAVAVTRDAIYKLYKASQTSAALCEMNPEGYTDVNGEVISHYEQYPDTYKDQTVLKGGAAAGPFAGVSAEKGDFFILSADGKVYADSEDYKEMTFFSWENVAVFEVQKRMLTDRDSGNRETEITAAAILTDGTVLAEGAYAGEILSWGELNDISMSDTLIVGLKPDGTLRVAGADAEYVEQDLAAWQNIVAVKVGGTSKIDRVVNAIDAEGNCYELQFNVNWSENNVYRISPADGTGGTFYPFYKCAPDGTVYTIGSDGTWELYED